MQHGATKRKRRPKSGKRPDTKRIAATMAALHRRTTPVYPDDFLVVVFPTAAAEPREIVAAGTISEKQFPLGTVLTLTTGYVLADLTSVYDILDFMTGERPGTHQIPKFSDECEPSLRQQFPNLFPDSPAMREALEGLDKLLALDGRDGEARKTTARHWIDGVRTKCAQFPDILPEKLTVRSLPAGQHQKSKPLEDYRQMRQAARGN